MIEPKHLRDYVIRPVLREFSRVITYDTIGGNAEQLLLGTAFQESACCRYLHQLGAGPACGPFQMEPMTHNDLWVRILNNPKYAKIRDVVESFVIDNKRVADQMHGNLYYAAAMCRIKYYADPAHIPADLMGQAATWKRVYNTHLGKGTAEEYIANWNRFSQFL